MTRVARPSRSWSCLVAAAVVALAGTSARAAFDITLNFAAGTSPEAQAVYNNAAAVWEGVVTGYKPGVTDLTGITINASFADLSAGVLGSAGPNTYTTRLGSAYALTGTMQFNTDYYGAGGSSLDSGFAGVVLHEMGHVLGIGTLWGLNGLYTNGTGQYTGAAGLSAYKTEFNQPLATFVPVELGGGGGTANGHWNEVDGGSGLTGITSIYTGQDFAYELMTGWLNSPTFLSSLTRFGMVDLGYTVSAIPEPTTLAALGGVAVVALRRRRATVA